MLAPEPGHDRLRATYLEALEIHSGEPCDEDILISDASEIVTFRPELNLIADLLSNTPNLRRLFFKNFHESVISCKPLMNALASLRRISYLYVSPMTNIYLSIVRAIPSDLGRLSLTCLCQEHYEPYEQHFTLVSLFETLSAFRNLTHVKLENFTVPRPITPIVHSFPSIRHVEVVGSPWIVDLCPNICTVSITWLHDTRHTIETFIVGPRWPPLQRLTVCGVKALAILGSRLSSVDALEVRMPKIMTQRTHGSIHVEEESFVKYLLQANPISLYRPFLFREPFLPAALADTVGLRDMAGAAPRLRSLKFCLGWDFTPKQTNFWEGLSVSLVARTIYDTLF